MRGCSAKPPDGIGVDQLLADERGLGRHHGAEAKGEQRPRDGGDSQLHCLGQVVEGEVEQHGGAEHPDDRGLPLNLESAGVDVGVDGARDAGQGNHGEERVAERLGVAVAESQIILLKAHN